MRNPNPEKFYTLPEAFNVFGKKEHGEAWTGEEAVDGERRFHSTDIYAPEAEWEAAERYSGTLEKFKQVMALGIPAEQLAFPIGWCPLPAHYWEVPGCWISIEKGQIDVEDGGYNGRKVRIERAPFDRAVSGEPLDDARGEDSPEVEADRLSEPSPQEVPAAAPPEGEWAATDTVATTRPPEIEVPLSRREQRKAETEAKYQRWHDEAQKVKGETSERPLKPPDIARKVRDRLNEKVKPNTIGRRLDEHFPGWSVYERSGKK